MSVMHDANYQYALNLLTYCIAAQKGVDLKTTILILDRLLITSALLLELHMKIEYIVELYDTLPTSLSYLPPSSIQVSVIGAMVLYIYVYIYVVYVYAVYFTCILR